MRDVFYGEKTNRLEPGRAADDGAVRREQCGDAIGFYYENGVHTQADPAQAVAWYEKAAKKGHPEAQLRLGLMAAQGRGMEKDPRAAFGWLKKGGGPGNANAQFNVGRCYEEGIGVKKDISRAVSWFAKAAKKEDFRAVCCLGMYYLSGEGVEKNEKKAFGCFETGGPGGDSGSPVQSGGAVPVRHRDGDG